MNGISGFAKGNPRSAREMVFLVQRFSMGKIIVILFLFAAFSTAAQKIKVGLRTAASFSNFYSHSASGPYQVPSYQIQGQAVVFAGAQSPEYKTNFVGDRRTGFSSALFIDWKVGDRWALESGIGYAQKGINLSYSNSTNDPAGVYVVRFNRHINIDYITVPVVAKYSMGNFYFIGGLYNAFAISFKSKDASYYQDLKSNGSEVYNTTTVTKGSVNFFDGGLVGGCGYTIPLAKRLSLAIDVRANVGLINVPGKYSESGFFNFSSSTKNINLETGLRISYSLEREK